MRRVPPQDRRCRLSALRRRQGDRHRRSQARRPYAQGRRNPIGQVHQGPARRTTALSSTVAFRLPSPPVPKPSSPTASIHSPHSREIFTFHRPDELIRLAKLGEDQLRSNLRNMPALDTTGLWKVQAEAITNLERSLADNRPRSLIQMATGSGKTYTACSFSYRLIKFAKAKRILFLVDRKQPRQTDAQ